MEQKEKSEQELKALEKVKKAHVNLAKVRREEKTKARKAQEHHKCLTMPHMYRSQIHLASLRSVLFPFIGLEYLGWESVTQSPRMPRPFGTGH